MKKLQVPEVTSLSPESQKTLDGVKSGMGFLPNVFAFIGHSASALKGYLVFNRTKTAFTEQETEVINLVTSQVRGCIYCLSAHAAIAKNVGFTDEQIIEIRKNQITFDTKLSALANMVASTVRNNGKVGDHVKAGFFDAGYTETHLVDLMIIITKISFTNYINNVTEIPVDFPIVPEL